MAEHHYNKALNGGLDTDALDYLGTPSHLPRLHISPGPVNREGGSISLAHHPFSIIIRDQSQVYHFSNKECAVMTADHLIKEETQGRGFDHKMKYLALIRIYSRESSQTYERIGESWI